MSKRAKLPPSFPTLVQAYFAEYLTEERRTLPTQTEAAGFYRDVDQMANDVERAEARLALLRERLKDRPA